MGSSSTGVAISFSGAPQGASGAKMSEASGGDPLARHDGSPWKPSDAPRKKNAGLHHGIRAALSLVKADWKAFKEIFSFPGWQGNEGICWLCRATLQDMRTKASTTDRPLTHWTFLHRQIHEYGSEPAFGCSHTSHPPVQARLVAHHGPKAAQQIFWEIFLYG